jgi:hypothetical protein
MKRQKLRIVTSLVMAIYGSAIFVGFFLSIYRHDLYGVFKDLSVLIIAIPAAYLAYSFQKRTEYRKTLRDLWLHMVEGVQMSIGYTHTQNPPPELYTQILTKLSIVIDEVRGVFKNVDEKGGAGGIYPFEPLKEIHREIKKLSPERVTTSDQQKEVRNRVIEEWKELRSKFLLEFDRDFPTYTKSPYLIDAEG